MARAVLADDQVMVWAGFRVLLEGHGDIAVVGEAADGRKAVTVVVREHPDVVYMGLWMPTGDGLTAIRQTITSRQDGSPAVLVVTTFDLDAGAFDALKVGVDGSILKDCESEGPVDIVRRLAAGYGLVDHTVTRRMITEFAHRHAPTRNTTEIRELTARELEIVKLPTVGMSSTEIATELMVETSTMKSHLTRILPKIDTRDRVQVVVWVHCNGLTG